MMCAEAGFAGDSGASTTLLTGPEAHIGVLCPFETDTFRPGARLYTNRNYVVAECPELLRGKRLLRSSIDWTDFVCVRAGVLTVLTPDPGHRRACSRHRELEALGFTRIAPPERFQLFGKQPFDLVRIYQKRLAVDERLQLRKWVVIVGFASAVADAEDVKPWSESAGELLYNGIRLPKRWPPRTVRPHDDDPMRVPYLDHPPDVIPIDVGRQLFVDGFLIDKTDLERQFHHAEKYEGNPVLWPETELEKNGEFNEIACPKSGGLWWDPAERVFKMWYEAGWIHTICYATSRDGIRWDRPSLDIQPGTNRVLREGLTPDSWAVFPDYEAKADARRYKMYMRPPGGTMPGLSMVSPDGIHWSDPIESGPTGDRSTMFHNPFRRKWVYSLRDGFRRRSRSYWECDDFLAGAHWALADPVMWAAADRLDPPDPDIGETAQLYNLDAVAYESIMLGMFEIHLGPPNDVCTKMGLPKITELQLAYSRDGFHWHRPDRRPFIRAERRDVWDRGYVQSVGGICLVRGDRLWFYYTGFRGDSTRLESHWRKNGMYDRGSTGVAFLRRDGFASMNAGTDAGTLLTRPLRFTGTRLFVNANVAGGELRAEVTDLDGKAIEPFTFAECVPIEANGTILAVRWRQSEDMTALRDRPVRIRFLLRGGAIFAFWMSRDETGRSDGYVAAGGPGFTGHRDTVGRGSLAAERELTGAQ